MQVLPTALVLVKSPLLQGAALEALQAFFTALPAARPAKVTVDALLTALLQAGQAKVRPECRIWRVYVPIKPNARIDAAPAPLSRDGHVSDQLGGSPSSILNPTTVNGTHAALAAGGVSGGVPANALKKRCASSRVV